MDNLEFCVLSFEVARMSIRVPRASASYVITSKEGSPRLTSRGDSLRCASQMRYDAPFARLTKDHPSRIVNFTCGERPKGRGLFESFRHIQCESRWRSIDAFKTFQSSFNCATHGCTTSICPQRKASKTKATKSYSK
jgi:hypothetical protein